MSLLHPPPGFPPHLAVIWPLIWVQILMLRAWVRATYGKGTQYHWSVTPCGRVFIASIDWLPGQTEVPAWLKPAAHPNARVAAALDGRMMQSKPLLPWEKGLGMRGEGIAASAAHAENSRSLTSTPLPREGDKAKLVSCTGCFAR